MKKITVKSRIYTTTTTSKLNNIKKWLIKILFDDLILINREKRIFNYFSLFSLDIYLYIYILYSNNEYN